MVVESAGRLTPFKLKTPKSAEKSHFQAVSDYARQLIITVLVYQKFNLCQCIVYCGVLSVLLSLYDGSCPKYYKMP